MLYSVLAINLIFICVLSCGAYNYDKPSEEECSDRRHRRCYHEEEYTEQEVENARVWLQKRFAKTNPLRKPCERLHVRKDIKCMTRNEVNDLIDVVLELYANGVIDKFAELHATYWTAGHKFAEGIVWHIWFINEMEKEMMKINPSVTMPYWEFETEYKGAEKSIVFDYFGHSGNALNDYCIPDSRFANVMVNYPNTHCVRRHWKPNNTTQIWESPEWITAIMQMGIKPELLTSALLGVLQLATPQQLPSLINILLTILSYNEVPVQLYTQLAPLIGLAYHFKTHLSLGGWEGDLSVMYAPNDFLFYPFHEGGHINHLKWQLQNKLNLVPDSYTLGARIIWDTQQITLADLNRDNLTYYSNVTVREVFQLGFGEQCYIYDSFIKPINDIINKKKATLPKSYYRLKAALPPKLLEKYYPKFALYPEEVTFFDYNLPDIGNCNLIKNGMCRKLPIAKNMTETANGRRQWQAFIDVANYDITHSVGAGESIYVQLMKDLDNNRYCSIYA